MANNEKSFYELYRTSSIGVALTDTLDELISNNQIEPQLAMKIIAHFDKAFTETISEKVRSKLSFKGHLDTYRFCDDVWTFLIKDVTFKLDNQNPLKADKVKIVSCTNKKAGNGRHPELSSKEQCPLSSTDRLSPSLPIPHVLEEVLQLDSDPKSHTESIHSQIATAQHSLSADRDLTTSVRTKSGLRKKEHSGKLMSKYSPEGKGRGKSKTNTKTTSKPFFLWPIFDDEQNDEISE